MARQLGCAAPLSLRDWMRQRDSEGFSVIEPGVKFKDIRDLVIKAYCSKPLPALVCTIDAVSIGAGAAA